MSRIWTRVAVALLLGAVTLPTWADDPRKKEPPAKQDEAKQTPAEKFAAAKKAQDAAAAEMNKVVAQLRKEKKELNLSNPELKKAFDERNKSTQELVKAAEELAKAEPTSAAGFDAIGVVINNSGAPTKATLKILTEHHVNNPKIGTMLSRLMYAPPSKELNDFLNAIIEKNPSVDAKGNATFTLANILSRSGKKEDKEQAEKLFDKIVTEFKDVKSPRGTLGESAKANLFELRNLQIGKVVPEIEGEDMDGKKFKLSDYRGKVVMLDFWGHW